MSHSTTNRLHCDSELKTTLFQIGQISFTFLLFFGLSFTTHASRKNASIGHIFVAIGNGSVGAVRIGKGSWEGGVNVQAQGLLHINKLIEISEKTYTTFGLGVDLLSVDPGIMAGVGFEFLEYTHINFRLELSAHATTANNSGGTVLIGLTFY